MTSRRVALFAGLLAAACAVVLFALSIDRAVYAPGAFTIQQNLARTHDYHDPVLSTYWFGSLVYTALRKAYSIVAFTLVGFFAAPSDGTRSRVARAALLVALLSLGIEIAQRLLGSPETNAESAFDILCGAVGGALGALAWNFGERRFRNRVTEHER